MIGHVVVGRGTGTGAWVHPVSRVQRDPDLARTLLGLCARHSVAAWNPVPAIATLTGLEQAAGVEARDWAATAVAIPDLLVEIGAVRSDYEKRVADERAAKPSIVPLEWAVDIPEPIPADAEALRRYAPSRGSPAPPLSRTCCSPCG